MCIRKSKRVIELCRLNTFKYIVDLKRFNAMFLKTFDQNITIGGTKNPTVSISISSVAIHILYAPQIPKT